MGRRGGAPTDAGWGEDRRTGPPAPGIAAARERSESPLRPSDAIPCMSPSHAPPPEPNGARMIWRNGIGAVVDTRDSECSTRFRHSIAPHSNTQLPAPCSSTVAEPSGDDIEPACEKAESPHARFPQAGASCDWRYRGRLRLEVP